MSAKPETEFSIRQRDLVEADEIAARLATLAIDEIRLALARFTRGERKLVIESLSMLGVEVSA